MSINPNAITTTTATATGHEVATQAYQFPLTIKHLLNRAKSVSSHQEIVYADKKRMTYADFFNRLNRLANVLTDLGLQAGDIVAVMDWDSHRYLESYFAVPMCQYVLQTINIRLSPEKILYTINHAKPKVLMLNAEFAPLVKDYQFDNSSIEHIIWLDDQTLLGQEACIDENFDTHQHRVVGEYEQLLADASDEFEFADFDENSIATTFYTSGTTGNPKGVFFSHRQLVLHTLAEAATFGMMPSEQGISFQDVYMPLTPMFHVHAWGVPYIATMAGIKQIYPGRYEPQLLLKLIRDEKVSFTHCVPTILQMLLQGVQNTDINFGGLKMVIGGSKLTEGLAKAAIQRGIEVYTGYGMSETAPLICTTDFSQPMSDYEQDINRRCKTGVPVMLVDTQIWDSNHQQLSNDGQIAGELVLRAPWLTMGYYKNADASEALWQGGYMHTADIAKIESNGTVVITDRLKDVIKSGGEWISSLELETILSLHPAVADVAVIGVPDDKWGERPLALIVKKDPQDDIDAQEILALTQEAANKGIIPSYGVPKQHEFVTELPKTSVGKHDKKRMREMYG